MYEILLIDLDDTIFDFKKQEYVAIRKTLRDAGLEPTEAVCARYSQINDWHWKQLEKGVITRDEVLHGRFRVLFQEMGIQSDPRQTALNYMENLGEGHYYLPGAEEAIRSLGRKYRVFLASNGTASVQNRRIQSAGLQNLVEGIFISQDIGVNKPAKGYFDYCFAHIPGFDITKTLMVGDSLSSDILGGQNAGLPTCWVAPKEKICTLEKQPTYRIESIRELEALLAGL